MGHWLRPKVRWYQRQASAAVVYPYTFEMDHDALDASIEPYMQALGEAARVPSETREIHEETIFLKIAS